ncbi:MAG: putative lipid II flippase FtsW [Armatimonadota bacterium]|nr:putative lipid II flippase FtsW [Armatimonadota bacterium]
MSGPMAVLHRRSGDVVLFATVLALVAIGLVMVYSASSVVAYERLSDSAYFFKRQAAWAALGLAAMWVARSVYHQRLRRLAAPLLLVAIVLLVAVLIPGVGRVAGGARRWIAVGPASFQPVEVAKVAVLVYMAHFAARRGLAIRDWRRGIVPPLAIVGLCAGLVLQQPDMGSAVMLAAVVLLVLFLAGARMLHLALVILAALPAAAVAVVAAHYRLQRVLAFLDPWSDPQGRGFHVIQSLLAFGSGGLWGVGLGGSSQKFFYLPERHTDFIFAIIGEELGLLGTMGLLGLFALFAYRGFRIARAAPDRFSALLAAGITATIAGQALLNMGVATGLLPVTGVPLPFVSFGGSSLVMTMIQVGILSNISQYAHREAPPVPAPRPVAGQPARAWEAS